MQADAVAVWKTSGQKRMRSEGTDAPVVLTDTAEKTHPVVHPVPARKALPVQPAERPAKQHQQQRSDAYRSVQPWQLQQQRQAHCGHEDARAQHAKQEGMASVPQTSEQARLKSCELTQQVPRHTAADRAQQAEHAQQVPLILNSEAAGHAQQAQHAQQEQHGKVTAHTQQAQHAQQAHAVFDKPGKGAGQAQHAQQPQHAVLDKPGKGARQDQHAQPAQRAQQARPLAPLQADQRPTTIQIGIGQSGAAASQQTRAAGFHEGQIAVQSSGSELHVKRSHTAADADEPNKRHKVPCVH